MSPHGLRRSCVAAALVAAWAGTARAGTIDVTTGTTGLPHLVGTGTLVAGSPGSLALGNAKPSALAVLFMSLASTPTPFKGGTLVPVPVALSLSLGTDGAGLLTLPFTWPAGLASATSLYFQYAIQDAAGPAGAALSNAVEALTP